MLAGTISIDEACARLRAVGYAVTKPPGTNGHIEACRRGAEHFYRVLAVGGRVSAQEVKDVQMKDRRT